MKDEMKSMFKMLSCGNLEADIYVVTDKNEKISAEYEIKHDVKRKTICLNTIYENTFRDFICFDYSKNHIECRRVFENISDTEFRVKELEFDICGINFEKDSDDDYFYHIENPRIFGNNTFPVDYDRMNPESKKNEKFGIIPGDRWPDMGKIDEPVRERIGASLFQPFPAILVSNYQSKKGIVHGTLSQEVFFHNYEVVHNEGDVKLKIYSSFMDIDALTMEKGRIIVDKWYLGTTENADDIEKIFEGYTSVLREKFPVMYGMSDANRTSVAWGSWNDGLWRNISEDILLEEARFLKDNFPTVKWFQVDDGYAVDNKCLGLGLPYDENAELDHEKFPNGMRHYTDKLREIGIRPAVWVGGKCPFNSKIYEERPDWFIDYSHIFADSAPLDVSKKEVRDFMKNAIKKLFTEYGFDAVKLDFWSHPFEDADSLLSNTEKSGYEWRKWWLMQLRNVLPSDGYLQTGCDIAMGNPFLGEFATNYRYGIDISMGNWKNVKLTLLWGINCFATHTGDMFVPNSDSIGLFPGLTEEEAMFVINFCLVTHSMVEIAGQLSKSDDKHRITILKKAICNPNNGQDVYFVNYDYRAKKTKAMPDVMYFKTPHFSVLENVDGMPLVTTGLFNTDDEKKTISVKCSELGLPEGKYTFVNVWNGEIIKETEIINVEINPHASALYAVCKEDGIQLYDANVRINKFEKTENSVTIETDYRIKDGVFTFNKVPRKLLFNGQEIPFEIRNNSVIFDAEKEGRIKITF